jgi:hypothetical protein
VGWWPDLGAWKLGKIVHDPMVHVTHRFSIPEVGTLSVSVEVPRGFQAQGAEALLPTEPFDRNVFGTFETFDGWRHLDWDDVEHAFVANLPVGNHALIIRGLGLSESHHSVRIDPGAVHTVRDSLERGVETTLVFLSALTEPELGRRMSRGMLPLDTLQLEVKTPTGTTMLQLPAKNQRMVERGFEFCIWLPESTTEVRAETRSHEERPTQRAPWKGLRKVEPGELDATSGARHRLEVVFSSQ